jgi:hypothetical protein
MRLFQTFACCDGLKWDSWYQSPVVPASICPVEYGLPHREHFPDPRARRSPGTGFLTFAGSRLFFFAKRLPLCVGATKANYSGLSYSSATLFRGRQLLDSSELRRGKPSR